MLKHRYRSHLRKFMSVGKFNSHLTITGQQKDLTLYTYRYQMIFWATHSDTCLHSWSPFFSFCLLCLNFDLPEMPKCWLVKRLCQLLCDREKEGVPVNRCKAIYNFQLDQTTTECNPGWLIKKKSLLLTECISRQLGEFVIWHIRFLYVNILIWRVIARWIIFNLSTELAGIVLMSR